MDFLFVCIIWFRGNSYTDLKNNANGTTAIQDSDAEAVYKIHFLNFKSSKALFFFFQEMSLAELAIGTMSLIFLNSKSIDNLLL